ncbi:MAG: recA-like protein [Erythrobacter sp.]
MMMSHPVPGAAPDGSAVSGALPARPRAGRKVGHKAGGWRPGLAEGALHSEIFASAQEASGAGLALALARDALSAGGQERRADGRDGSAPDDLRQVLWVQDRSAIRLGGRPYLHGLPPDLRHRLIHVAAKTPQDALFAMEEGLKCRDLACVIGEIAGNCQALNFTASRRLSLAAERARIALWLVRLDAAPDLSSARMRWRVEAAPSRPPRWNAAAPGAGRWRAELFRARHHAPGEWMISDDTGRLCAESCAERWAAAPDRGDLAAAARA